MNFSELNKINLAQSFLQEHQPDYEKAGIDLLKDALKRTYTERFLFAKR